MIGLAKLASGPSGLALAPRVERDPGAGETLLEVYAAGVCGTDLHIEAGEYPSSPPVTLGHEVCGVVAGVGIDVDPAWLGQRVVSETFFSTCGRCQWCRDGRPNLCPARQSIGSHVDGAFAPRLIVPELNLHAVPDGLSDHAASLAEPLACVCQCMLDPVAVFPGDRVGVVGPGPMGLLAAQLARALGGEVDVYGLPSDDERLATASALGFATSVGPGEAEPPFDVAIDASGSASGVSTCLERLRRGGRFVQIGIAGKPVTVPLDLVLRHELDVSTGFASTPRAWRRAMRAISRRDVELEPLVTEIAPLADWERVFASLRAGRGVKVVLDPRRTAAQPAIGSDLST